MDLNSAPLPHHFTMEMIVFHARKVSSITLRMRSAQYVSLTNSLTAPVKHARN